MFLRLLVRNLTVRALRYAVSRPTLIGFVRSARSAANAVTFLGTVLLDVEARLTRTEGLTARLVSVFRLRVNAYFLDRDRRVRRYVYAAARYSIRDRDVRRNVANDGTA